MLHKTYELVCRLSAHTALERIEGLLSEECVEYKTANLSVTSTQTPLVLLNIDPRGYSHTNWVGLNPFTLVSGVDVRCEPGDNGLTKVIVRVNRFRAVIVAAFSVANGALVASVITELGVAIRAILFIGFACVVWFGMVSFLGGYLIKKEIGDHLKEKKRKRRWYVLE